MSQEVESTKSQLSWDSLDMGARHKLVQLISSGMPTVMMADFLGVEPTELNQLFECAELKQLIAKREAEERLQLLDSSSQWDKVENLALKNVLAELNSRPDPEYALRAAMAANKAIRSHKNQGVNVVDKLAEGGKTITLQLSQNVVNHLTQVNLPQQVNYANQSAVAPVNAITAGTSGEQKIFDVFTSKDMERLTDKVNGGTEYNAFFEEVTTLSQKPEPAKVANATLIDEVDKLIDGSLSNDSRDKQ